MRLNTTRSLQLAGEVKAKYGTWRDVIEASRLVDGIYVVCRPPRAPAGEQDRAGDAAA